MPKFIVTFKWPSAGTDAIKQAVEDGILKPKDESKALKCVQKFVPYDEYAYIEMDTDKMTATVLPNRG